MEIGKSSVQTGFEELMSLTLKCRVGLASSRPSRGDALPIVGNASLEFGTTMRI